MSRELSYVLEKEINCLKIPVNESIEEKRVREKGLIDDARVRSIIVNKLSKDAFNLVGHESSAYRMITGLRDKYKSDSTASVIARLDKLFDLVYDPARTSITSHVADMVGTVQILKETGNLDWDKLLIVALLRSMPRSVEWSQVTTSLKTHDTNLSKDMVIRTFIESDRDIRGGSQKNEKISTGFNRKMAFNIDRKKEKNGFIKAKVKCYKCQKMGHFARECRVKIGADENEKGKSVNHAAKVKNDLSFAFINEKKTMAIMSAMGKDPRWIKDS
ncbi:hypothetical protein HDU83_001003, partial [Entophlyctis luteolus]